MYNTQIVFIFVLCFILAKIILTFYSFIIISLFIIITNIEIVKLQMIPFRTPCLTSLIEFRLCIQYASFHIVCRRLKVLIPFSHLLLFSFFVRHPNEVWRVIVFCTVSSKVSFHNLCEKLNFSFFLLLFIVIIIIIMIII